MKITEIHTHDGKYFPGRNHIRSESPSLKAGKAGRKHTFVTFIIGRRCLKQVFLYICHLNNQRI